MTTYEYLQKVISTNGCTFEGCVYYAKQCASKLVPILARTHGTRAKRVLRNMLFTVMASDEYLTFTERKFIAEVLGWEVVEVDGHDMKALYEVLVKENEMGKPRLVIAKTIKGKGVSIMENDPKWHYRMPKKKELSVFVEELGILEGELI